MIQSETGKRLSPKQLAAIDALLSNQTTDEAASVADVSRATVNRWLQDPDFKQALLDAETTALQQISRNLIALATKATDTLNDALEPDQKIATRLRATEIVTDRLLKIRELVNMEERLTALENKVNNNPDVID